MSNYLTTAGQGSCASRGAARGHCATSLRRPLRKTQAPLSYAASPHHHHRHTPSLSSHTALVNASSSSRCCCLGHPEGQCRRCTASVCGAHRCKPPLHSTVHPLHGLGAHCWAPTGSHRTTEHLHGVCEAMRRSHAPYKKPRITAPSGESPPSLPETLTAVTGTRSSSHSTRPKSSSRTSVPLRQLVRRSSRHRLCVTERASVNLHPMTRCSRPLPTLRLRSTKMSSKVMRGGHLLCTCKQHTNGRLRVAAPL